MKVNDYKTGVVTLDTQKINSSNVGKYDTISNSKCAKITANITGLVGCVFLSTAGLLGSKLLFSACVLGLGVALASNVTILAIIGIAGAIGIVLVVATLGCLGIAHHAQSKSQEEAILDQQGQSTGDNSSWLKNEIPAMQRLMLIGKHREAPAEMQKPASYFSTVEKFSFVNSENFFAVLTISIIILALGCVLKGVGLGFSIVGSMLRYDTTKSTNTDLAKAS
ncbi:MAG: hypothetical protein H7A39_01540 [Chlamydiales bacterium]|nr:hypothetical protein [Chlamydiales bacterium]